MLLLSRDNETILSANVSQVNYNPAKSFIYYNHGIVVTSIVVRIFELKIVGQYSMFLSVTKEYGFETLQDLKDDIFSCVDENKTVSLDILGSTGIMLFDSERNLNLYYSDRVADRVENYDRSYLEIR